MLIRTQNVIRMVVCSVKHDTIEAFLRLKAIAFSNVYASPLLAAAILGCLLPAPSTALAQTTPVWTPRIGGPLPRSSPAMAYDSLRGVSVLFGGNISTTGYTNETWEWNGVVWSLRQPTSGSPSTRNRAALAYDSVRGETVMFGGGSPLYTNETWVWNGSAWSARAPFPSNPKPPARAIHAMAFDAARGNTVLFGGLLFGSVSANDTWIWNGTNWTRLSVAGPSARAGHQMVYDSHRQVVVLFGGDMISPSIFPNNETWEWNGSSWNQRIITGPSPSPRSRHTLTYDQTERKVVLYGGRTSTSADLNNETWTFDGNEGTWTQVLGQSPGFRSDHVAAYDSGNNATFTFGGTSDAGLSGETWGFGEPCLPPVIVLQDLFQALCPGNTATLSVTVQGSPPLSYQWRKAGVPIPVAANPTAAFSALQIPTITDDDTGLYDCVVTNGCTVITSSPARLTARSPADISGGGSDGNQPDGIVDGNDFITFINAFAAGC